MKKIPDRIESDFKVTLEKNDILAGQQGYFVKCLHYYLDFCEKYDFDLDDPQSLPYFIDKLKNKRQGVPQQEQVRESISIFHHLYPSDNKSANKKLQAPAEKYRVIEEDDAYPASFSHDKNFAVSSNQDRIKTIEKWDKACFRPGVRYSFSFRGSTLQPDEPEISGLPDLENIK